jgi:hypothetical protein
VRTKKEKEKRKTEKQKEDYGQTPLNAYDWFSEKVCSYRICI